MTLRWRAPWLASAGLHLAGLIGLFLMFQEAEPSPPLRMHFVTSGAAGAAAPSRPGLMPASPRFSAVEVLSPAWHPVAPAEGAAPSGSVPVSLAELLLAGAEEPAAASGSAGWSGPSGLGYSPPPLPPPGLSPPQGSQWTLRLTVPAGGGPARAIEGLDSGHPALDQWLEEYLRTVSFPSSPDGQDYQIRWALRLQSEKPQ